MITKEELKENFKYEDGNLYLIKNNKKLGWFDNGNGYLRFSFKNKKYYVHKVIFSLFNNEKQIQIDHINGNKLDNRIENLRNSTLQENAFNRGKNSNNKSGYKGVSILKNGKYSANININGKKKFLGDFIDIKEAQKAYIKASNELYKEFSFFNR